jgi:hypothetical protein
MDAAGPAKELPNSINLIGIQYFRAGETVSVQPSSHLCLVDCCDGYSMWVEAVKRRQKAGITNLAKLNRLNVANSCHPETFIIMTLISD